MRSVSRHKCRLERTGCLSPPAQQDTGQATAPVACGTVFCL
jgi:hypothetical protein